MSMPFCVKTGIGLLGLRDAVMARSVMSRRWIFRYGISW